MRRGTAASRPRRSLVPIRLVAASIALILGIVVLGGVGARASVSSQMVGLVNSARASNGLAGVDHHSGLASVAQSWAVQMAGAKKMSHNPNTGAQIPAGWNAWAENVAFISSPSARKLHQSFMDSPPHRANIMGPYTHIGVGYSQSSDGTGWVVEVFAKYPAAPKPKPSPTTSPEKKTSNPDSPPKDQSPESTSSPESEEEEVAPAPADEAKQQPLGWLGEGSQGEEVKRAQSALREVGYTYSAADGVFGPRTTRSVVAFQSDSGLVQDGLIGPITMTHLDEELKKRDAGEDKEQEAKDREEEDTTNPPPPPEGPEENLPDELTPAVEAGPTGKGGPEPSGARPPTSPTTATLLISAAIFIVAVNLAGFLLVSYNRRARSRRWVQEQYTAALHELGLG